jgi:hypothetical protein
VVILDNKPVERKTTVKNIGVLMDETLTWTRQVNKMISTAYYKLKYSYRFKNFLSQKSKITISEGYILSHFNYWDLIYKNITEFLKQKIQKTQNTCIRFIFDLRKYDHISSSFTELKTLNMEERRTVHGLTMMHKIVNNNALTYLTSKIRYHNNLHNYNTRNRNNIVIGISRTATYDHSFFPTFSRLYNDLNTVKNSSTSSVETIKKLAKKFVIDKRA